MWKPLSCNYYIRSLLTGQDSISISSFPIFATSLEVLYLGWMFTSVASPTLPGNTFKKRPFSLNLIFLVVLFSYLFGSPLVKNLHLTNEYAELLHVFRRGCFTSTQVWLCERTFWERMEVIFVHGNWTHSLLPYVNLTYALCFKFVK